jgi:hypothetical protein
MTRDQILTMVSTVVAEELLAVKAELTGHVDRAVAAKPLPPFVPPPIWTEGRHGAGSAVRHRNGLFLARRDTEGEPGKDDGWLPLLVGLAGLDLRWEGERTVALRAMLSDGSSYEMIRTCQSCAATGRPTPPTSQATACSASANSTPCKRARASSQAGLAARSTG